MKGGGDKAQKPPGLLEAYSTAFAGKPFNQLDPDSQKKVLAQYQQYQNDPKLAAFQRSQDEYDRRFQKQQDAKDTADKEKDNRSLIAHGNAVRSSVTGLQAKAAAQLKMYNAVDQTQETRAAGVDILNAEADDLEQQIQDGIADGTLPEDFKAPKIRHYQVDPESGGIAGFFKKPGLAKPAAASSDIMKGTPAGPSTAGTEGELRRSKQSGEYRVYRGGKWVPSDATGNPIGG